MCFKMSFCTQGLMQDARENLQLRHEAGFASLSNVRTLVKDWQCVLALENFDGRIKKKK